MKHEFIHCYAFCLVGCLAVSGAGIISKFVCPGDSVEAFQNITFSDCSSVISLYINGERNTLIARWSNCSRNETLLPDYNDRVFLNGNGTVSIHNVHPWDEAKYTVDCQMGNISREDVVQIIVMAAPASDCIPNILHLGSSLFASLKSTFCGKPVVTLYWKGYGDVPITREPVLNLNPENQNGTYYACIEGPALTCVRNALDYCSTITTGGSNSPPILTDTLVIFIVVGIVLVIILATSVILIRKHCRNTTRRTLKSAVVNRRANGNSSVTFSERTGGGEVKNMNSKPGASRVNIGSEDPSDDFQDEDCMPLLRLDQHRPTNYDTLHGQTTAILEKNKDLWIQYLENLNERPIYPLDKQHNIRINYFDELAKYDTATKPTLSELGVELCGPGSGTEDNQGQLELSQEDVISTCSSRSSDLSEEDQVHKWLNDHPDFLDKYLGKVIEEQVGQQIQQKLQDAFPGLFKNTYHGELEKYDTTTKPNLNDFTTDVNKCIIKSEYGKRKPTLSELPIKVLWSGSGTEDNQFQLESSQEDVIFITSSSCSSVTFSDPGHSGTQPFNSNEHDANPEQDMAQDVIVLMEGSDSEDKCKVPLLEGSC